MRAGERLASSCSSGIVEQYPTLERRREIAQRKQVDLDACSLGDSDLDRCGERAAYPVENQVHVTALAKAAPSQRTHEPRTRPRGKLAAHQRHDLRADFASALQRCFTCARTTL